MRFTAKWQESKLWNLAPRFGDNFKKYECMAFCSPCGELYEEGQRYASSASEDGIEPALPGDGVNFEEVPHDSEHDHKLHRGIEDTSDNLHSKTQETEQAQKSCHHVSALQTGQRKPRSVTLFHVFCRWSITWKAVMMAAT